MITSLIRYMENSQDQTSISLCQQLNVLSGNYICFIHALCEYLVQNKTYRMLGEIVHHGMDDNAWDILYSLEERLHQFFPDSKPFHLIARHTSIISYDTPLAMAKQSRLNCARLSSQLQELYTDSTLVLPLILEQWIPQNCEEEQLQKIFQDDYRSFRYTNERLMEILQNLIKACDRSIEHLEDPPPAVFDFGI